MDRYTRVEKPKPESPINENEIRITSGGPVRNYISYATSLLQEKHVREVVLKAMGQAISKTVSIAEGIKRRNPRLHQDTAISSVSITDVWEPIEEGLLPVEQTRQVSMITITLSFRELNKNSPGYQAPHSVEQPKEQYPQQQQQPRQSRGPNNAVRDDSYARGRGRGRGRGRNWGRGGYGYGNYQGNYQGNHQGNYQDNGGYTNWGRGGGRGRSWGYRGTGYERGRGGGGGRGYGRGRGRMGGRSRGGGGNQG
ncbi:hypothetical protein P3X46_017891 [Hevea brasiliensis]|uniref:DNA/RNA-binding protein Alba-like domain-containing protein n=1 Tax=Hevea brasiliensis TaxID=3981 RepID=A0ABQ9LT85_HEVBR|nr:uncharacterized protein LOC110671788 isoform X2 [Hevea brasiliensis]KAJ9169734.1 hypothetical protein P3X46_017891 [Hevea brasiliensis]